MDCNLPGCAAAFSDPVAARLYGEIRRMPAVDTHEHLPARSMDRNRDVDVLREYLAHYFSTDLVSAGIPAADMSFALDPSQPLMDRWSRLEKWWDACRHTGYGRMLDRSVRILYGIDGIRGDTLEALQEAFAGTLGQDHFRHVLKDVCGIRLSVTECWDERYETDRDLFRRVWNPSLFTLEEILAEDFETVAGRAARRLGGRHESLDQWIDLLDAAFAEAHAAGIATVKLTTAYSRSLRVGRTTMRYAREAWRDFTEEMSGSETDRRSPAPVELQDFLIHRVLEKCREHDLTVQIHTGHFEGKPRDLRMGNPTHLTNLFTEYPDVTFDLFHGGYPYYMETAALCKMHPNVHADLCWTHVLSPNTARNAVAEFLDTVPWTKISAFGGDCAFVDAVAGHLDMARENLAHVLAAKVRDRVFDEDRALRIASAMLHDNPIRILKLKL